MKANNCELEQKYSDAYGKAGFGSIVGVGISFTLGIIKAVTDNSIDAGSSTGASNEVTAIGYIVTNIIACYRRASQTSTSSSSSTFLYDRV